MYYKIVNKNSEVYKNLNEMRLKELNIGKENELAIKEKIGIDFVNFLGDNGQQNFRRVPQYIGFEFLDKEKVDLKIWKPHDEYKEIYVPNRKTKLGREMSAFLTNGLKGNRYDSVFKILGIEHGRKFSFPFVHIAEDVIVIYLSNEIEDEDVIEITSKEFNEIINKT